MLHSPTPPSRANEPTLQLHSVPGGNRDGMAQVPAEIWLPLPPDDAQPRSRRGVILFGGLAAVMFGAIVALLAGAIYLWQGDWVAPGVTVFGIDLGGRSTSSAAAALSSYWQQHAITLELGESTRDVSPETLGISFDPEATARLAHRQGRTLQNLGRWIEAGGQLALPPVWVFDAAKADANLAAIAPSFEIKPVNATVKIVDGQVVASPAVTGRRLDVGATMNRLRQNPAQIFLDGRLALDMVPLTPEIEDVGAIVKAVNELLGTTLSIRAFDPVNGQEVYWQLAPENWGKWLSVEIDEAVPAQFSWSLKQEPAKAYFLAQVQSLGGDRYVDWEVALSSVRTAIASKDSQLSLRVYHHPTQHIVQPGETFASLGRLYGFPYPWIQDANPTLGDRLNVGQAVTIPSPDEMLPLPVVESKRIVVSISQQQLWAYENGDLKWDWPASTGIDSSPTSPGVFQIQSHEANAYASIWNLWMPYFMGIYLPVPDATFMNGFHGFPTRDGATLLWTGNLGHPVTYGCILISTSNAEELFAWADEGVVVEVRE